MNKIAIIEDDIDICNMIAKFLENNKYIVHYALNGAEGIELCKSLVPDLIILDIMLPKLNGNDVLQRLRKFTNAPVIVVSAKTMVQTKIDLLKLGADDYMTKPFDLHELLARIEANLKRTSNTSCQNDTLTYRDIEINNSLVYIKEVLVTILISSHILSELHQLATCYGFLHKGELLKQISTEELNEECKRHICLRTDNIQKTTLLLEQKGNINNYSVYPDNSIRIYECLDNVRMISKLLSSNGVIIDEISVQGENLETYFENLIGGRKNV